MTIDTATPTTQLSYEQINDICRSVSAGQAAVLVEAYDFTIAKNSSSSGDSMHWYHRGKFGFGITKRTAKALSDKGLVQESIWEQWFYDTQFVRLTARGFVVAEALAERQKAKESKA